MVDPAPSIRGVIAVATMYMYMCIELMEQNLQYTMSRVGRKVMGLDSVRAVHVLALLVIH